MSLTFYYAPNSTASLTEGVLAELGVPHERVKLDLQAGDTRRPEFLKINPNGRVPAIVHEGVPIWESAAITMYLGETFGVDANLYPAPGPTRGEAMKWIAWSNVMPAEAANRLAVSLSPMEPGAVEDNSQDWVPVEQRGASMAAKARADLAVCFKVLDGGLERRPFLLGEYSLADTHVHGFVWWIELMQFDLTPFVNVSGWKERCRRRPALAKQMAG